MLSSASGPPSTKGPCRYWQQHGKCFYESECKFQHGSSTPELKASTPGPGFGTSQPTMAMGMKSSLSTNVPSFTPKSSLSVGSSSFTPTGAGSASGSTPGSNSSTNFNPSAASFSFTPSSSASSFSPNNATASSFTPSAQVFTPSSQSFTPSAQAFTPSTASFTPSSSNTFSQVNAGTGLGLNPNKSPFRPTTQTQPQPQSQQDQRPLLSAASARPFIPSNSSSSSLGSLSVHSNEFVPSSQTSDQGYFEQEQDYQQGGYDNLSSAMHHLSVDDVHQDEPYYSNTNTTDAYGVVDEFDKSQQETILPLRRAPHSFFMSDTHREELAMKQSFIVTRLQPDDPRFHEIPQSLNHDQFHSLYPLQSDGGAPSALIQAISPSPSAGATKIGGRFGMTSSPTDIPAKSFSTALYKATSTLDGLPYVIRRCIGCRLSEEFARQSIIPWQHMQHKSSKSVNGMPSVHPNIVGIHGVFTTAEFGDGGCLCFIYDYHPGAISLENKYFGVQAQQMTEEVLWSYIIQLVSALASIHSAGLHCHRLLDVSRILVTGYHRIRINCVGMYDTMQTQRTNKTLREMQYDDLFCLGKLITTLACQNLQAVEHIAQSMAYLTSSYSADIKNLVTFLLSKPKDMKLPTIFNVTAIISHRMVKELHHTYDHMDTLESELSKEIHNGRLFRLISKLGFINERPDTVSNPRWSETGDRYLLKLYRDFLFHTQRTDGAPIIDFGHVVDSLNKLDSGSSEKTLLSSRNQESLLVVRYSDLKRCMEDAYRELLQQASQPELDAHGTPLPSSITDQQQQMLAAATMTTSPYKTSSAPYNNNKSSTYTRPSVLQPLGNPSQSSSRQGLYRPPSQLFVPGQQTTSSYTR